ncbi:Uncharacterised protein [Mycobacteroides abscessus]|nr:Uncharacterised protein [Mycobacteroides abscessus]
MLSTSLDSMANMVIPKTIPAVVTTPPVPPNVRTMPVRKPAPCRNTSSRIRMVSNRL